MEEDINEVLKSAEQIGYIVGKYGTQKEKDLLSVLLSNWQEVRTTNKELEEKAAELCRKNAEQQKMIELMAEHLEKHSACFPHLYGANKDEWIDYFTKKAKGE